MTLPLREVRASPEGKNVRVLRVEAAEAAEALKPVYTRYARGYRGVFDAETHQWKDALAHSGGQTTYAYVHQPPDAEADGYFLWRYGASEGPGRVREWVANTPEAYRGLLSVLHYLGTQCEKAVLSLPAGDPLTAHLMDWDMETKVHPVFMGRVVDLPAAFAALAPAVDTPAGVALLQVRDEHAPWNEGLWRVEVGGGKADGGKVTCAPAPPGSLPALTCDIQAISQAYWGMPSLEWLRRASRVEVHDERAFQFLTTLLPGACVWTLDDF